MIFFSKNSSLLLAVFYSLETHKHTGTQTHANKQIKKRKKYIELLYKHKHFINLWKFYVKMFESRANEDLHGSNVIAP